MSLPFSILSSAPPPSRHRAGLASVLVGLSLTVALTGCSGGSSTGDGAGGTKTAASDGSQQVTGGPPDASQLKFVRCLRDKGVEVEDPEGGNLSINLDGQDADLVAKAQKDCEKFLDTGKGPDGSGSGGAAEDAAMTAYRLKINKCMRGHGLDVSDTAPGEIPKGQEDRYNEIRQACVKEIGPAPQPSATS
ncbi:hypothetical protein ACIBAI_11240 [Streptomyces sp. NPDC051041]|uniref:hypothetical protein n=1 Tax=Streptomyces sp. NPDC051041 TaxID=3365640 RepID=UPI0037B931BB